MRSNMFANIENKFQFASKEEIIVTALDSLSDLLSSLDSFNNQAKFSLMVVGAKLGVAGDGKINDAEKELIDDIFGRVWKGSMADIYQVVGTPIEENDYSMVKMLTQMGNQVAIPFLHYILSFAYIDEVLEDDVAEKLDELFGMNLMVEFFNSDLEDVPAPKIKLVGLEAEIVSWFQSDDQLHPLKNIQAHFSNKSKTEVKAALDSLCEKGILYGGENIIDDMSGLV